MRDQKYRQWRKPIAVLQRGVWLKWIRQDKGVESIRRYCARKKDALLPHYLDLEDFVLGMENRHCVNMQDVLTNPGVEDTAKGTVQCEIERVKVSGKNSKGAKREKGRRCAPRKNSGV